MRSDRVEATDGHKEDVDRPQCLYVGSGWRVTHIRKVTDSKAIDVDDQCIDQTTKSLSMVFVVLKSYARDLEGAVGAGVKVGGGGYVLESRVIRMAVRTDHGIEGRCDGRIVHFPTESPWFIGVDEQASAIFGCDCESCMSEKMYTHRGSIRLFGERLKRI